MKRANAMSPEELKDFYNEERHRSNKKIKTDFLEEAIQLSVNAGFKDDLISDLISLRDRLMKYLRPTITIGPDRSFFYFHVQGKKVCIVTPNQISYNRKDRELLQFLETLAINMYPEVAYQAVYRDIVQGEDALKLKKMSDPKGLIHNTDFLPKFLAFLMGFEFVQ